jgi:hypothetical protein
VDAEATMFGEDFSRFSWWRALVGAAIGTAMAFYAYGRTGNKWSWLAVPGMAVVFGLDSDGGSGGGGDGDSGGGDGD